MHLDNIEELSYLKNRILGFTSLNLLLELKMYVSPISETVARRQTNNAAYSLNY